MIKKYFLKAQNKQKLLTGILICLLVCFDFFFQNFLKVILEKKKSDF